MGSFGSDKPASLTSSTNSLSSARGWGQLPSLPRGPRSGLPLRWRPLPHLGGRSEKKSRNPAERFPPGSGCLSPEDTVPWERCRPAGRALARGQEMPAEKGSDYQR